jgi:hypothetical protein
VLAEIAGEVVVFDLDAPPDRDPYFHNMHDPRMSVPDITQMNVDDFDVMSAAQPSIGDVLHRDMNDCLRNDRKLFWQVAVQEKLGMAVAKTKTAATSAMRKGLKFLKGQSTKFAGGEVNAEDDPDGEGEVDGTGGGGASQSRLIGKGNYAYEGGFPNELSEEMARIAFATFFVCLYGDVRSYLTQSSPGTLPMPDRQKFMKYRVANGDAPGSGMAIHINNFLRCEGRGMQWKKTLLALQVLRGLLLHGPISAITEAMDGFLSIRMR